MMPDRDPNQEAVATQRGKQIAAGMEAEKLNLRTAIEEEERERLLRLIIEDWPDYGMAEGEAERAYEDAGDHPRAMAMAVRAAMREGARQDFPDLLAALEEADRG